MAKKITTTRRAKIRHVTRKTSRDEFPSLPLCLSWPLNPSRNWQHDISSTKHERLKAYDACHEFTCHVSLCVVIDSGLLCSPGYRRPVFKRKEENVSGVRAWIELSCSCSTFPQDVITQIWSGLDLILKYLLCLMNGEWCHLIKKGFFPMSLGYL